MIPKGFAFTSTKGQTKDKEANKEAVLKQAQEHPLPNGLMLRLSTEGASKNALLPVSSWNGLNHILSQLLLEGLASN